MTCAGGSTCTLLMDGSGGAAVECAGAQACAVTIEGSGGAAIDGQGAGTCDVAMGGSGPCHVACGGDCRVAGFCEVACPAGPAFDCGDGTKGCGSRCAGASPQSAPTR